MRSITPLWLRCIVPAILLGCVSAGCASSKATQTPPEAGQAPAAGQTPAGADAPAAAIEDDAPATAAPTDLPKGVVDAPDHFIVGAMGVSNAREPRAGEGCRNPMVDPRDGTTLKLVRSKDGRGDYEVPPGRYGVADGKLLRLDCSTGRIVAIVKR